jgi:P-type Ca2+ transporter type 2C
VIIVAVGGRALSAVRLNGKQWGISLILGAISLPVAVVIRLIPDEFFRKLIPRGLDQNQALRVGVPNDERFEWNDALENIRRQLAFFKETHIGQRNSLRSRLKRPWELLPSSNGNFIPGPPNSEVHTNADPPHRSWARFRSNSALGPAAAMAGVVAGSIAGWSPTNHRG